VGAPIISDKGETLDYESIRVSSANENIAGILEKILDSYKNLEK
jgi:hypothetical protein